MYFVIFLSLFGNTFYFLEKKYILRPVAKKGGNAILKKMCFIYKWLHGCCQLHFDMVTFKRNQILSISFMFFFF